MNRIRPLLVAAEVTRPMVCAVRPSASLRRRLRYGVAAGLGVALVAAPLFAATRAALADAMEKKDLVAVRALIADSDVNAAQVDGMTALHWAVHYDDLATAKALLAAKANPNVENRYGVRPLSLACTNGNADMVNALLDAGADASAELPGGETALMTAARTGKVAPVKALLAHGADVNAALKKGQTAIMWAAADGQTAVVETLIAAGADFKTPLESGFTPLLFAVRAGYMDTVRALLKAGVDINAITSPTIRPTTKQLRRGASALTLAIENGRFELAAMLLDLGADPTDMRSGYTPLHILSWIRKPDIGEDEGDPIPEDHGHLRSDELIRKLVAKGANVNAQLTGGPSGGGRVNFKGCTPFMLAADRDDLPFLKILIELGADPTIKNVDDVTPLMIAAGLGTRSAEEEAGTDDEAVETCSYLLSLGADINAVSKIGDTAMHGAAFANFPKVVHLLAARGAKIEVWNQPNQRGWTPQRIAEGHRYGNFKPSFETVAAIKEEMLAKGVTPLPPMAPIPVKGYGL